MKIEMFVNRLDFLSDPAESHPGGMSSLAWALNKMLDEGHEIVSVNIVDVQNNGAYSAVIVSTYRSQG